MMDGRSRADSRLRGRGGLSRQNSSAPTSDDGSRAPSVPIGREPSAPKRAERRGLFGRQRSSSSEGVGSGGGSGAGGGGFIGKLSVVTDSATSGVTNSLGPPEAVDERFVEDPAERESRLAEMKALLSEALGPLGGKVEALWRAVPKNAKHEVERLACWDFIMADEELPGLLNSDPAKGRAMLQAMKGARALDISGDGQIGKSELMRLFDPGVIRAAALRGKVETMWRAMPKNSLGEVERLECWAVILADTELPGLLYEEPAQGRAMLQAMKDAKALDVSGNGQIDESEFMRLFNPDVVKASSSKAEADSFIIGDAEPSSTTHEEEVKDARSDSLDRPPDPTRPGFMDPKPGGAAPGVLDVSPIGTSLDDAVPPPKGGDGQSKGSTDIKPQSRWANLKPAQKRPAAKRRGSSILQIRDTLGVTSPTKSPVGEPRAVERVRSLSSGLGGEESSPYEEDKLLTLWRERPDCVVHGLLQEETRGVVAVWIASCLAESCPGWFAAAMGIECQHLSWVHELDFEEVLRAVMDESIVGDMASRELLQVHVLRLCAIVQGVSRKALPVVHENTEIDFNSLGPAEEELYAGAASARNGCVFFLPKSALLVACVNPILGTVAPIGADVVLSGGDNKYSSAVAGPDGMIYGIPGGAMQVLQIDPVRNTVTLIGDVFEETAADKWGQAAVAANGKIYAAPHTAGQILCIDPTANRAYVVGEDLTEGAAEATGGQWWGAAATDAAIYFTPKGAANVLWFDTISEVAAQLKSQSSGQRCPPATSSTSEQLYPKTESSSSRRQP